MPATLERDVPTASESAGSAVVPGSRRLTAVILDETADGGVESVLAALAGVEGAVTILVTRHPPPQDVIGVGAGVEAMVMWNDCRREYQAAREATTTRVEELGRLLGAAGLAPVEMVECFPTRCLFRRRDRREVDGVVRVLARLCPDWVVVDDAHHLGPELRAAVSALGIGTPPDSGGAECSCWWPPSRQR